MILSRNFDISMKQLKYPTLLLPIIWLVSLRLRYCVTDEIRYGPPCDSYIYCHGSLLHTVEMASLYPDSKTFVDKKLKQPANVTMDKFRQFMKKTKNRPTKAQLKSWVEQHFDKEGSEFVNWNPNDWVNEPKFLRKIKDKEYRAWAKKLNSLWKFLGRKMSNHVRANPQLYSIIYVPNPVIVPGGRFREFYYWDSYWIMRGLLLSQMKHTVRGMLENYLYIVQHLGFVPNGGRVYYKMRSQPPLLMSMIQMYFEATNDKKFIQKNVRLMEKEFQFWMRNRTVTVVKGGKRYRLARYKEQSIGPRPESYREDYGAAQVFKKSADKLNFYNELKSAAESGWDFSTRWFISKGTNKGNLTNIKTRSIVPVELNAILCRNARLLSKYFKMIKQPKLATKYQKIADEWMRNVKQVFWNENIGIWLDYDLINKKSRNYFYPSNIGPLWTGCFPKNQKKHYARKVLKYLEKEKILKNNAGGVPTSLTNSGQQWDYPNAWAPLQYIVIMALDSTNYRPAQDVAYDLAKRWTQSNYKAYKEKGIMYEKYDAGVPGRRGGGGEYAVQIGFGWTNGLIMHLLNKYGHRLTRENHVKRKPQC